MFLISQLRAEWGCNRRICRSSAGFWSIPTDCDNQIFQIEGVRHPTAEECELCHLQEECRRTLAARATWPIVPLPGSFQAFSGYGNHECAAANGQWGQTKRHGAGIPGGVHLSLDQQLAAQRVSIHSFRQRVTWHLEVECVGQPLTKTHTYRTVYFTVYIKLYTYVL